MKSFWFILRIALAWWALVIVVIILWHNLFGRTPGGIFGLFVVILMIFVIVRAFSHVRRVRLIAEKIDSTTLANRHRRQIEIPLPPAEAFAIVDAAIRELPYVDGVESTRDSMQIYARVKRMDPYFSGAKGRRRTMGASGARSNLVSATLTPGESVILCRWPSQKSPAF